MAANVTSFINKRNPPADNAYGSKQQLWQSDQVNKNKRDNSVRGAGELILGFKGASTSTIGSTARVRMATDSKDDLHNIPYEMGQTKNKFYIGYTPQPTKSVAQHISNIHVSPTPYQATEKKSALT